MDLLLLACIHKMDWNAEMLDIFGPYFAHWHHLWRVHEYILGCSVSARTIFSFHHDSVFSSRESHNQDSKRDNPTWSTSTRSWSTVLAWQSTKVNAASAFFSTCWNMLAKCWSVFRRGVMRLCKKGDWCAWARLAERASKRAWRIEAPRRMLIQAKEVQKYFGWMLFSLRDIKTSITSHQVMLWNAARIQKILANVHHVIQ